MLVIFHRQNDTFVFIKFCIMLSYHFFVVYVAYCTCRTHKLYTCISFYDCIYNHFMTVFIIMYGVIFCAHAVVHNTTTMNHTLLIPRYNDDIFCDDTKESKSNKNAD